MRVDYRKSGKPIASHKLANRATVMSGPMHIPDGFLSTPVWASLGAVSSADRRGRLPAERKALERR